MHEYSIVQDLFELIEENMEQNHAKSVISVKVSIGRLSGVEPHLFKVAFDTFKETTVSKNAELIMDIKDVLIRCNNCNKDSVLNEFVFFCPLCESSEVKVLEGEDMYLQSLELEK